MRAKPGAHAEIERRPDVEPTHLEHQEHLRGPLADAAHEDQLAHDLVVGEPRDAVELDEPVFDLLARGRGSTWPSRSTGPRRAASRTGARAPPRASAGRRTAPRTVRGSPPRRGPRAAGSRSCARARRSADGAAAAVELGHAVLAQHPLQHRIATRELARACFDRGLGRHRSSVCPTRVHEQRVGIDRRAARDRRPRARPRARRRRSAAGPPSDTAASSTRVPVNVERTIVASIGPVGVEARAVRPHDDVDRARVLAASAPRTRPTACATRPSRTSAATTGPKPRKRRRPRVGGRAPHVGGRARPARRDRRA